MHVPLTCKLIENELGLSVVNDIGPKSFDQALKNLYPNISRREHNVESIEGHKSLAGEKKFRKKKLLSEVKSNSKPFIHNSYFSCIAPRHENPKKTVADSSHRNKSNDSISSSGESSFCLSNSKPDIVRCNTRILGKSDVGVKIWKTVSDLGVVSKKPDSVIEGLILEMEKKDKEVLKEKKCGLS